MKTLRFGLTKYPGLKNVSKGLQSRFGLTPLEEEAAAAPTPCIPSFTLESNYTELLPEDFEAGNPVVNVVIVGRKCGKPVTWTIEASEGITADVTQENNSGVQTVISDCGCQAECILSVSAVIDSIMETLDIPVTCPLPVTHGYLYTISKRGSSPYAFYLLEYDNITGELLREVEITSHLGQYANNLLLVADASNIYILDTGYRRFHKFDRETFTHSASLYLGLFTFPGWPYNNQMSDIWAFAGDDTDLYVYSTYASQDYTGNGNWSYFSGGIARISKSTLTVADFKEGFWQSSPTPSGEYASAPGDYFIIRYNSTSFRRYSKADLSYVDVSPSLGYTIDCMASYSPDALYCRGSGHMVKVDQSTWDILLDVAYETSTPAGSSIALDTINEKTYMLSYYKAILSFIKETLEYDAEILDAADAYASRLAYVSDPDQ